MTLIIKSGCDYVQQRETDTHDVAAKARVEMARLLHSRRSGPLTTGPLCRGRAAGASLVGSGQGSTMSLCRATTKPLHAPFCFGRMCHPDRPI